MSNIYKGEMQDYEGNTVYPHTEADVVFCTDGTTVQNKLNKYENAIGSVTGKTDSLEVSDSNVLATAKAVNTLNSSLTANDNLKFQFATDGEGNYGYLGADDSFIPFKKSATLVIPYIKSNLYSSLTYVDAEEFTQLNIERVTLSGSGYRWAIHGTNDESMIGDDYGKLPKLAGTSSSATNISVDISEYRYILILMGATQSSTGRMYNIVFT